MKFQARATFARLVSILGPPARNTEINRASSVTVSRPFHPDSDQA
jgi:hypothetical protein